MEFTGETTSDVCGLRRATRIGLRPGFPPQNGPRFGDQPYRHMVEQAVDGLLVVAADDGRIVYCNPAAATLLKSSPENLTGTPFGLPVAPANDSAPVEIFTGGEPVFVDMHTRPISWQGKSATLVSLHDVSAKRIAEARIEMQAKALEAAANGIYIIEKSGVISWANSSFAAMAGYGPEELCGQPVTILAPPSPDDDAHADLWTKLVAGETWKGRIVNLRKDGSSYTAEQTVTPITDITGRLSHFVAIQEDISERLKTEGELIRLTEYDGLTGLPNRHVFMHRAKIAIERASRTKAMVAVMVLDLDNFKSINNTLGHEIGDKLLAAVAQRISSLMRSSDTLARLGGDDYGILFENVTDMAAASRTVRSFLNSFRDLYIVDGHTIEATASIGIAAFPKDDNDPPSLLRHAELAMYQAKAEGRDAFRYFDREMDADIRRRVRLEADLRHAVEGRQLWLAYQPQLDLASGQIVGAEALIRWNHPERGLISPGEFIPIAEASSLILPIGDWIIEEICRQHMIWQVQGMPELRLGFNVSGVQFRQKDLFNKVAAPLARSGLSAKMLDIEITETVAMERTGSVQQNVDRLTAAGISMSMDDFGTGYSSLSNLQAFPVCRLKVDGSFVKGIGVKRDDEKIVEAVVRLGQSMGLTVVAEGVETPAQLEFLRGLGCDEIQGYYISKPLAPEDFRRFVADFRMPS
ncbi:MAG: EAL domain-containing protein [Rhodospirillaceae bacterium]|nr:EAL domain-containing protein [Rhodospirillaceae bacterium]